jgi:hypothetical protein
MEFNEFGLALDLGFLGVFAVEYPSRQKCEICCYPL